MKRSTCLLALAVGVLALTSAHVPRPVQARTVANVVIIADVTVGGFTGLGYPILTLTTATNLLPSGTALQTLAHLFGGTHPSANCLQLPNDFGEDPFCLTNSHWTLQNLRTLTANSIVCLDGLVNIAKPGKAPVHPPGCQFATTTGSLPNTISGHCGLSSGQMTWFYGDGLGNNYLLDLHFKEAGGVMVIGGHWRKFNSAQHGLVLGVAQPIPPIGLSQSCLNKTARNFTIPGVLTFIPDPRL